MAITPKSKGLSNIGSIVNRQGQASPTKPVAPVAKPVLKAVAKPVAPKVMPKQAPKAQIAKTVKPNPFTAKKPAAPGVDSAPIQGQQRNPITGVTVPKQPGATQPAPGKTNPMVGQEQKPSGLNQIQQDYFKYRNSQRDLELQNEQASQAASAKRQQAINNAGYGTGSAQYGHYDEVKDAAALKFIADYDAANPYKDLEYDRGYDDIQRYAETKLGYNPRDPNNPNLVGGYAAYDMGLRDVRKNPGMLAYVPQSEGYQDSQGNYYDLRGNPMAKPSFIDEEQKKYDPNNPFGSLFGGQQGPSTMESPRGPDGRYLHENMLGVGGMFGGQQGLPENDPNIRVGDDMYRYANPFEAAQRQMNTIGITPPMPSMQDDRGFGGPGSLVYGNGQQTPQQAYDNYKNIMMTPPGGEIMTNFGGQQGQGQPPRTDFEYFYNNAIGYNDQMPQNASNDAYQLYQQYQQRNPGTDMSSMYKNWQTQFPGASELPPGVIVSTGEVGGNNFDPNASMNPGNSLATAFNPQDKNQYNGGGFMSGNSSGSLFGGGGFAGK